MGKKDDKKKKGKGAEKTATKTEKKQKLKLKKELANKGEDDIESMVKAIEEEERKRQEVKESSVGPPSHRSNFSMTPHPNNPEIIFFGGEFYNGQKTLLNNDFLIYNIKRGEWTQVCSPGGPPPRSSHQAVAVPQGGGQLWVFGGEFVSPSESQFYHYKDLWCFHFSSKRWEKVSVSGGPSSRSGHRMVMSKKQLVVFGGFHDNTRDCKYFNDLYAFDLEERKWKKLETVGTGPTPRSACQMFTLADGRIVVYGGYCKEKLKKDVEKGVTHQDMFVLSPDKHDQTGSKWRWQLVKQTGIKPSLRTGLATAAGRDSVFMFGGVQDKAKDEEEGDSDEEDEDVDLCMGDINKKHLNDQQNEDQPRRKRLKEIHVTKVVDAKNTHVLDKVKQCSGQLNFVDHKLDKIGRSTKLDRVNRKNKILPRILPKLFSKNNKPVISGRSFPPKSNPTKHKLKEPSKVSKMDSDVELVELKKRQNNQEVTEAVPNVLKAELEEGTGNENQNHKALDTILCGVCNKPFSKNAGALIVHAETHGREFGGKGKRKCTQCNDFEGDKTHLLMHMRAKHTEEKLFKCQLCNASFSTCAAKKTHEKKHV